MSESDMLSAELDALRSGPDLSIGVLRTDLARPRTDMEARSGTLETRWDDLGIRSDHVKAKIGGQPRARHRPDVVRQDERRHEPDGHSARGARPYPIAA